MDYHNKYIKYKQKYLKLKNQQGGKIPYVELDNGTKDYFPFDNNNFNYYLSDHTLILNDEKDKVKVDYLLNEKFKLKPIKLGSEKKTDYDEKNIINNNNIYKLADENIIISSVPDRKFPFHLCLLTNYKILDELYQKHINKIIDTNEIKYDLYKEKKGEEKDIKKLRAKSKKTFLINNTQAVFKIIFNIPRGTNIIFDITYHYNILLKYSYCNKFLELLKLIYDIQSKIVYENFDIFTTNTKQFRNFEYIKIFLKDNDLEKYIIVKIINFFISPDSDLKDNFDKIYDYYTEKSTDEQHLEDYINAIETYINISDTTFLFKNISGSQVHFKPDKTKELLKKIQ